MSFSTVINASKLRKERLLPNRGGIKPWKELRFNHYSSILQNDIVIMCHRQPLSAEDYESFKYELQKNEWKCTIAKSSVMNAVLEEKKFNFELVGPTILLFGSIGNFNKIKIPKSILPMSIKVFDQLVDFNAIEQVTAMEHSRAHLLQVLNSSAQNLSHIIQATPNRLLNGLQSLTSK